MLEKGLQFTSHETVRKENFAKTLGSGDLEVFATPALVALLENAAMYAVANELPTGSTTVGAMINVTHTKPSAPGETITACATLLEVDGRKLTFSLTASDTHGVIGEGTHIRYIVDRAKFLAKLNK